MPSSLSHLFGPVRDLAARLAWFHDPDGRPISIYTPLDSPRG